MFETYFNSKWLKLRYLLLHYFCLYFFGCTRPSLQKLADGLPGEERRELLQARAKLISSAEAARDRNRRNGLLLASSLKLYKGLLDICCEAVDTGVYSAPGTAVPIHQPVQVTLDLKI